MDMNESIEAYAPGRVELLGNHTDYNEGLALSLAIDKGTTVRARRRAGGRIELRSAGRAEGWAGDAHPGRPLAAPEPVWCNYILGVMEALRQRGVKTGGVCMEVDSTVPVGAGLSSSAALEMSAALALCKLYPFKMDPLELAKAGQWAEHHYAGTPCGLLDQISVLMSREGHATFIDFRSLEVRHLPLGPQAEFVIVHTGVHHELVAGDYKERRTSCEEAARLLGKKALRDVAPGELEARKGELPDRAYRRAAHVTGENHRVAQAVGLLSAGRLGDFGRLMFESHESSRVLFENSCPELDFLVGEARGMEACLGARLSGGGFGGATINLVRAGSGREFGEALAAAYERKWGSRPLVLDTKACGGAR
jgi:galactokinase